MKRYKLFCFLLLAPLACLRAAEVANLRCEYRENPLGIDVVKPQLSWALEDKSQKSEVRGQKQTAYQIMVASSEELLAKDQGDLWDSGKVERGQSVHVEYKGKDLHDGIPPRDRPQRPRFHDFQPDNAPGVGLHAGAGNHIQGIHT